MSLNLYVGPDSQPDKYRLVRSVGRGGEATLYLAEVSLAGQTEPVVVKVLNSDVTANEEQFAELSAKWGEQAELLRFINRLGVVGVREHFEGVPEHPADGAGEYTDRALYLVMNYVQGVDLRDWRAEHAVEGPRGQREVLRYLEQIALVLDMLHSGRATPSRRVVVHGDLSPGNIMISDEGQATLVDFGLSRIAARHMTARPWFTPGYAAPEIFNGEYSAATDRYAFGAIAFFALTGEDPPPAPEQLRERFGALPLVAGAGERQRGLVMSMFSAEPGERPETSDWIRALRSLATSVPWTGPVSEPGGGALAAAEGPGPTAPPSEEAAAGAPSPPLGDRVSGPPPESAPVPGAESMPPRPVGGMRGRPSQVVPPTSGPQDAGPAGPPPGKAGPQTDGRAPGGPRPGPQARPPFRGAPPRGPAPQQPPAPGAPAPAAVYSGPAGPGRFAHAGPQPGWNGSSQPGAGGALPHAAARGTASAEAGKPGRRRSRKPVLIGLAIFGVLCVIAGATGTYVVMDRFAPTTTAAAGDTGGDTAGAAPEAAEDPVRDSVPEEEEPPAGESDAPASPEGAGSESTLLTQMEVVDEESMNYWRPETGRAELDGESYSRAIVSGFCADHSSECTGWIDYNLGRDWTTFTSTLGVDDTSNAGATTTFTVHVDGEAKVTETLRLGEMMDVEVDVSHALRLRLEVESDDQGIYPVWADPMLSKG
ncbi:phosphotransferase [Nocardiopsis sp. TSRI0078]|uniref:protein kinase domain-containing protein n=1 Tax=unclassified Nocardiopsis TaxID=2649073 RepID=UPI00093CEAE5|nr:protein kinase [Nocardiopsis sp. TSRI0078]OKI12995.1 phosphotransferase [Nocardiopsis sp. TSRI0078]